MSLERAYALQGQRQKSDPLERGLSAGSAAYRGQPRLDLGTLRSSVEQNLSQAAAQRQMIADNAAKQAAGAYGNTGTSAAAYDYLRGRGGYPTKAVPDYMSAVTGSPYGGKGGLPTPPTTTLPIQKPYEQATNVGDPTQASLAKAARTSPTKMGARPTPPGMAKPSMVNQLLGTLGPMYLGYSLLDKGIGMSGLGTAYNNFMYPTGIYGAEGDLLAPNAAEYFRSAAPSTAEAAAINEQLAAMPPVEVGPPVQVADASGALPATTAGGTAAASDVGYTNAMDAASDAAAAQAAADAGAVNMGTATGADMQVAYDLGEAQAAAEGAGIDWAAMSAEYGPYVAAAIILDELLLDGQLRKGVGNVVEDVAQGVGNVVEDVVGGVGDIGQGAVDEAKEFIEDPIDYVFGGCFMTTAAVDHAGEKDDGKTLTAMRKLRDDYLKKMPEGRKEIEWYYRKAPKIVAAIDKKPNAHAIYMRMYNDHIKPTARAVDAGNMELAHQRYNKMIGFAKKVSGLSDKEMSNGKQGIPKDIKKNFNTGGITALAGGGLGALGGYSDGGRLLRGPGDGVSDSIPAVIGNKQPARLADGEFVVPARIVSELGNGSTEAGARKLYAMMDRIQKGRKKSIGKGKVAVNSRADKHLPA